MAAIEKHHELWNLLRQTEDAHYRLYLALFKFNALANYLETPPESAFQEVEAAIAEVQNILEKARRAMMSYIKGEMKKQVF